MEWKVAEAKNKFSELLDRAESEGPQYVRRRGQLFVVGPAERDKQQREPNPIVELLLKCDFDELNLERPDDTMREVDLG